MIFLAQKWTNFKLHQNDHPPKWSKLRTRGKLESFLMISSVLRQLFFRFVLCENHFYEDQNENRRKNSLFLLRNPRLCILYTLLLQKPVPGTVCKGISNAKHPIFWIWTLTLSATSNSTKMIIHQNDQNLNSGESWKVFWWLQMCSFDYFVVLYCAKTIFMKAKWKNIRKTHYFFCETIDCVFCTFLRTKTGTGYGL